MAAKENVKICEDVHGKSASITNLVQYVGGSVVSRTIVDKPVGTVTLFAFDKDQNLSEHTAPYDAIVQVTDGTGEFTVGGKNIDVSTGQMLIMPANVPHSVQAKQRFMMLLTMIRS